MHIYVAIPDASILPDPKELQERILIAAWLAGHGRIELSKSGAMLKRCVIDVSVLAPERLVFEAAPELGEGLEQRRPKAEFIDGGWLV